MILSEIYAELERIVPRDMAFSVECAVWRHSYTAERPAVRWSVWAPGAHGEGDTAAAAFEAFRREWGDRPEPAPPPDLASVDAALDVGRVAS